MFPSLEIPEEAVPTTPMMPRDISLDTVYVVDGKTFTNPRSQRSPRFQSGGGIGEQRGENKRILFTLN